MKAVRDSKKATLVSLEKWDRQTNRGFLTKERLCRKPEKCVTCERVCGSNDCLCFSSSMESASVAENYFGSSVSSFASIKTRTQFSIVAPPTTLLCTESKLKRSCNVKKTISAEATEDRLVSYCLFSFPCSKNSARSGWRELFVAALAVYTGL